MENKIIIVGGGIVGNIFAWQLYFNNIEFEIYDNETEFTSSKVAAGIYNPIVFKRFTQSWMAKELIDYLDVFYAKIENEINNKIHFKIDIYKILSNSDEQEFWLKKSAENINFMDKKIYNLNLDSVIENLGFGKVLNSGYLDVNKFLELSKLFFISKNKYFNKNINNELFKNELKNNNKLVLCEGCKFNKEYFPELKFNFAKGEILDVKIKDLNIDYIISKNLFIFPKGNNIFKVGSTFEWNFENDNPTEKQKNNLIDNLKKIVKCDFEIINHFAGIRPATYDRRPFLGQSSINEDVYILNGMGAKGVMIAPLMSSFLFDNIFNKKVLPLEVDVTRCRN